MLDNKNSQKSWKGYRLRADGVYMRYISSSVPCTRAEYVVPHLIPRAANRVFSPEDIYVRDWLVEFNSLGTPSNIGDLPMLVPDTRLLVGTHADVTVTEHNPGCCFVRISSNGQERDLLGKTHT